MPIPEDFILGPLQQATEKISELGDRDHFEEYDYHIFPASERDVSDGVYPVVMTNVHMIPGEPEPRLHKTPFRIPDVPSDISEGLERRFAKDIRGKAASLGNDEVRFLAQQILEACEEIEEPSSIIVPFQTVAVFAIYNTERNRPFAYSFIAKPLVDALARRLPDPTSAEEMPEEWLRDMHANESEQVVGTEPFPEWRERARDSLFNYNPKNPEDKRNLAKATMTWAILPRAETHPVVNALLFPPPEQPEA